MTEQTPINHMMNEHLTSLRIIEERTIGALQVYGLDWAVQPLLTYLTLEEALKENILVITEVSEAGSVPNIRVINKGGQFVFMMAGSELVGARQNRVLNTSIMVPPFGDLEIPVSCVEAGRWGYNSRFFNSEDTCAPGFLREKMSRQVNLSYRDERRARADQGKVWEETQEMLFQMDSPSPSLALHKAYEDHRETLSDIRDHLKGLEKCHGAVFVVNGRIAGVDLFDSPNTFAKSLSKIARSYGIESIRTRASIHSGIPRSEVESWLAGWSGVMASTYPSPGIGQDVRLEAEGRHGALLEVEETPVHFQGFMEGEPGPRSSRHSHSYREDQDEIN